MRFKSTQIKGKDRGKLLGFPTINLKIPDDLNLEDGIYAVRVYILNKEFAGAMHYGPIPVFKENEKTLEVFLINTNESDIPNSKSIETEIVKYIRPVLDFSSEQELIKQMESDVKYSKEILNP